MLPITITVYNNDDDTEHFLNGAVWCFLAYILIGVRWSKKMPKIPIFYIKNNYYSYPRALGYFAHRYIFEIMLQLMHFSV